MSENVTVETYTYDPSYDVAITVLFIVGAVLVFAALVDVLTIESWFGLAGFVLALLTFTAVGVLVILAGVVWLGVSLLVALAMVALVTWAGAR